jgi:hypothetical protein
MCRGDVEPTGGRRIEHGQKAVVDRSSRVARSVGRRGERLDGTVRVSHRAQGLAENEPGCVGLGIDRKRTASSPGRGGRTTARTLGVGKLCETVDTARG